MLAQLHDWMVEAGVDAAYVTDPVSIAYLTGFRCNPMERLMALAVRASRVDLIVPGIEAESATATAAGAAVRGWKDGEDPYALVVDALGDAPGRLAVEKDHLSLGGFERLGERVRSTEVVDAGATLRRLRLRKSPDELERLAEAARITDRVTEQVLSGLAVGQSELEVAMLLSQAIAEAGAANAFEPIVQFGPNSAQPHLRPTGRRLRAGDLVLLDFGAAWRGYCADTTRTAVAGEPDQRQLEVHQIVLEAHDRALEAVRAGVAAAEVDEAARAVIREAGYGDYFIHRIGHGLGLDPHEGPSLDPGSPLILEPGMVVTIEPGVYLPGWGGVRIEDDVVVEQDGGRTLTGARRDLVMVDVGPD
jgi:Xaa-Pro dipeptidase